MGTVGSIRGHNRELLGQESEEGRENFGGLGLDVALGRWNAIFGCPRLL